MDTTNRLNLKIGLSFNESEAMVQLQKQVANLQKNMDKYTKSIDKTGTATDKVNKKVKEQASLMNRLGTSTVKTIKGFLLFAIVSGAILAVTTQIRRAVELMIELDTAFTNFRIVTKATAEEIAQVDARVNELTTSLGALKKEIIDAVTEFARAGFSISDSLLLAENAIQGANVGATDLAKVTTFLIAGLKSFKLEAEDSARILDVLLKVANTTAINLEGIGDAFLRSANTLQTAGATLEESASLIAGANESIQDPAKVGTALKTIASRLRGIGDEGEVIPTLAKDFKQIGIDIQNTDGSFRNIYDIFKDFAGVYGTLDDLTKESLLEKIAGKRQKNILIGLIENFDTVESSLENALNSAGEVAQANEKYLDSLQGRIKILTAEWQKFRQTMADSNFTKIMISGLTEAIKLIDLLINKLPILGAGLAILSASLLANPIGAVTASIVALILVGKQFGDVFNNNIKAIQGRIASLKEDVASLESEINSLTGIKNKTLAQENYLDYLNKELDIKKELLALETKEEINANIKNLESDLKDLEATAIDVSFRLNEGFSTDQFKKRVLETEQGIISQINSLKLLSGTLDKNSQEYINTQISISNAEKKLEEFTSEMIRLGVLTESTTNQTKTFAGATDKAESSLQRIKDQIGQVNSYLLDSSDDYQLVSDAIIEMEQNGYLADDMLQSLIKTYPELVTETGLVKDAFVTMANSILNENKKQGESSITLLKLEAKVLKERIALYQEGVKSFDAYSKALNLPILDTANRVLSTSSLNDNVALKNIENSIARLENESKQLDAIDKNRVKSLTESTKSTTESNKVLTEQERLLNEINYQIDIQTKLIQRLKGEDQRKAQLELINLYKQQKQAIRDQIDIKTKELAQIKSQKDAMTESNEKWVETNENYDDTIEKIRSLNLQYEDSTNKIYDTIDALQQEELARNKAKKEASRDAELKSIETLKSSINDLTDTEIANLEKAKKESDNYYDSKIKAMDKTIDETDKYYDNELDNLDTLKDKTDDSYDAEIERLRDLKDEKDEYYDAEIEKLEEFQDARNEYYDIQIKEIQDEIDARKEVNDELEWQLQLQDKINNLADLNSKRENILKNKNTKIVQNADIGFVNVSNPQDLAEINEQIKEAELDLSEFRTDKIEADYISSLERRQDALTESKDLEKKTNDQKIDNLKKTQQEELKILELQIEEQTKAKDIAIENIKLQIDAVKLQSETVLENLNLQLQALKDQKDAEALRLDQAIETLEVYQSTVNKITEDGNQVSKELTDNLIDYLKNSELNGYADRLTNLDGFIAEYNAKLKQLQALQAQIAGYSGGNVFSSGTTSTTNGGFNLDDVLFRTDNTTQTSATPIALPATSSTRNNSSQSVTNFNIDKVVTPNNQSWTTALANNLILKS